MTARLCLCGCGETVHTPRHRSRRYTGYRRGHCKRVAMPELVSPEPVLRVLARYDDPRAIVGQALGIRPDSARCQLKHWRTGSRMRRSTAERILRFVADLPRLPTKRQIDATRRQVERERKAQWRARADEARSA